MDLTRFSISWLVKTVQWTVFTQLLLKFSTILMVLILWLIMRVVTADVTETKALAIKRTCQVM